MITLRSSTLAMALVALPSLALSAGCGDGSGSSGGAGGTTSAGGTTASGGTTSAGGTTASGGTLSGGTGGTGGTTSSGGAAPDLDPALPWYGDNRQRLDAMIDELGTNGAGYDPAKPPVAIFDWDNTVIKNDIGDATVFWALLHDKILQPPAKNWALTSPYLTPEAVTALGAACSALAAAGAPLPTSTDSPCASEIVNVYYNGATTTGAAAFSGYNYRRMEPAYAWGAQLFEGHTAAEVNAIADSAIADNLAAPDTTTLTIGTLSGLNGWIRTYDQIGNLIDTLQKNGFDVWVVSASPQYVVEQFAGKVNIAKDHVVGIRLVESQGKLTANLQGCGPIPDGTNDGMGTFTGNSLITYIEGKRCWANKIIFGNSGATALDKQMDPAKRQAFGAGDSATDISFVQDATAMKLVINRNKSELMCSAYAGLAGKWVINPMFIKPKAQYAAGYPCSTTGCIDAAGVKVPCFDEDGAAIPDQTDTVF